MIKQKRIVSFILLVLFVLVASGCEKETNEPEKKDPVYNEGIDAIIDQDAFRATVVNALTDSPEDFITDPSNDFKQKNVAMVVLDDEKTTINNPVSETDIYMENGNLIVNSTKKMTLILKGTLNGSVTINKPDGKFLLILDGVSITSESGPAINLQTEKRCFIMIKDNTLNYLKDGATHPEVNGKTTSGALYSNSQIIFSGHGELNITARHQHGIAVDDYLKIISGNIKILDAKYDGIHAEDYVAVDGGSLQITAGSDGIEVENNFIVVNGGEIDITAGNDGFKTSSDKGKLEDKFIHINNGIIHIKTEDQGVSSSNDIVLNNGLVIIESVNDGLSSDGRLLINNGIHYIRSTGFQSLDGDIAVTISGGISILLANGNTRVIESDEGNISFNGGTVIAAGPSDIDVSESTQGYVKLGAILLNDVVDLRSTESLVTFTFDTSYLHVVVSTEEMTDLDTIAFYNEGTSDGNNFFGLFVDGVYTDGTLVDNIEIK